MEWNDTIYLYDKYVLKYFNKILWLTIFHIDILYHFIWEKFENRTSKISYISTSNKLANIVIKGLPHNKFEHFCNYLTIASPKDVQTLLDINEITYIIKEGVMKIGLQVVE